MNSANCDLIEFRLLTKISTTAQHFLLIKIILASLVTNAISMNQFLGKIDTTYSLEIHPRA